MKKNKTLGNLLDVTTSLPLFLAALEDSIAKNPAANLLLEQCVKEKVGVLFSSIILHICDDSVHLAGLTYKKNLSSLALVGGAA